MTRVSGTITTLAESKPLLNAWVNSALAPNRAFKPQTEAKLKPKPGLKDESFGFRRLGFELRHCSSCGPWQRVMQTCWVGSRRLAETGGI